MRLIRFIRSMFAKDAARTAMGRRDSGFTCADCERSHQCALPPSANCIFRAEQIARGDWKARRRTKTLLESGLGMS
jgi:hypothetical protein